MAAKKVPPTRFPDAAAAQYYRELKKLIRTMGKATLSMFDDHIKRAIKGYKQELKEDAAEWRGDDSLDIIRQALELIKGLTLGIFPADTVQRIASQFVQSVNLFNAENISQQGRVKGVDPLQNEKWLESFMRTTIAENVSYITNIRDDYTKAIESIVYQGVKNGQGIKEIRQELVKRIGMTESRAQFVAVDQAGSITGQMTARRHKAMGVEKFRWSTSRDGRVRPNHQALGGRVFPYESPPAEGFPGTPFRCRCVAIPVFDDEEEDE